MTADFSYHSTTRPDALANALTNTATLVSLTDGSTYPDPSLFNQPYTVILAYGSDREEVCTVIAKPTATTMTVLRGQDGTPATAKNAGDIVVHGVSAREFRTLAAKVDSAGDTMTGPLLLSGPPNGPAVATTRKYVDDQDLVTKDASNRYSDQVGQSTLFAANDYTDSQVGQLDARFDAKADIYSPHFTGNPTAPTPPVDSNDTSIANAAFVLDAADSAAAEAANAKVVDTSTGTQTDKAMSVRASKDYASTQATTAARTAGAVVAGSVRILDVPTTSIPNNVDTLITAGVTAMSGDTGNGVITLTSGALTATTAGYYDISIYMTWSGDAGGTRRIEMMVNNVAQLRDERTPKATLSAGAGILSVTGYYLAANSKVQAQVRQDSGAALSISNGRIYMRKVADVMT